jgi:hypothetical protein
MKKELELLEVNVIIPWKGRLGGAQLVSTIMIGIVEFKPTYLKP